MAINIEKISKSFLSVPPHGGTIAPGRHMVASYRKFGCTYVIYESVGQSRPANLRTHRDIRKTF